MPVIREGDRVRADVGVSVTAAIEGTVVGREASTGHVVLETDWDGAVFVPPEKIVDVVEPERPGPSPEEVERARGCMLAVLDGCSVSGDKFRRNLNILLDATEPEGHV